MAVQWKRRRRRRAIAREPRAEPMSSRMTAPALGSGRESAQMFGARIRIQTRRPATASDRSQARRTPGPDLPVPRESRIRRAHRMCRSEAYWSPCAPGCRRRRCFRAPRTTIGTGGLRRRRLRCWCKCRAVALGRTPLWWTTRRRRRLSHPARTPGTSKPSTSGRKSCRRRTSNSARRMSPSLNGKGRRLPGESDRRTRVRAGRQRKHQEQLHQLFASAHARSPQSRQSAKTTVLACNPDTRQAWCEGAGTSVIGQSFERVGDLQRELVDAGGIRDVGGDGDREPESGNVSSETVPPNGCPGDWPSASARRWGRRCRPSSRGVGRGNSGDEARGCLEGGDRLRLDATPRSAGRR